MDGGSRDLELGTAGGSVISNNILTGPK